MPLFIENSLLYKCVGEMPPFIEDVPLAGAEDVSTVMRDVTLLVDKLLDLEVDSWLIDDNCLLCLVMKGTTLLVTIGDARLSL